MAATVTIILQLSAGLTKADALTKALVYPSVQQWKQDGHTVYEYDAATGIARFPQ